MLWPCWSQTAPSFVIASLGAMFFWPYCGLTGCELLANLSWPGSMAAPGLAVALLIVILSCSCHARTLLSAIHCLTHCGLASQAVPALTMVLLVANNSRLAVPHWSGTAPGLIVVLLITILSWPHLGLAGCNLPMTLSWPGSLGAAPDLVVTLLALNCSWPHRSLAECDLLLVLLWPCWLRPACDITVV